MSDLRGRRWTIHVCEEHRMQDCVVCGIHDVVSVSPTFELDQVRAAALALVDDIETYGEPRRHAPAIRAVRETT